MRGIPLRADLDLIRAKLATVAPESGLNYHHTTRPDPGRLQPGAPIRKPTGQRVRTSARPAGPRFVMSSSASAPVQMPLPKMEC